MLCPVIGENDKFDKLLFFFPTFSVAELFAFLSQIDRSFEFGHLNAPINGSPQDRGAGEGTNPREFDIFRFLNVNFPTLMGLH